MRRNLWAKLDQQDVVTEIVTVVENKLMVTRGVWEGRDKLEDWD